MKHLLLLFFFTSLLFGQGYCQYDDTKLVRDVTTASRRTKDFRRVEYRYKCENLFDTHYYWIVDRSSELYPDSDRDFLQEAVNMINESNRRENQSKKKKGGYKKCPYCAEEIKKEAIKCWRCGEFLTEIEFSQKYGEAYGDRSNDIFQSENVQSALLETKTNGFFWRYHTGDNEAIPFHKGARIQVFKIIRGSYIFINYGGEYGYTFKNKFDLPDSFGVGRRKSSQSSSQTKSPVTKLSFADKKKLYRELDIEKIGNVKSMSWSTKREGSLYKYYDGFDELDRLESGSKITVYDIRRNSHSRVVVKYLYNYGYMEVSGLQLPPSFFKK